MDRSFKDLALSLGITMLSFLCLDVLVSSFLPFVGLDDFRIPFNVLFIIYMGFKFPTPFVAMLIIIVQYFHSFFSVDGWEVGTVAGVIICVIISYFKDIIYLSSSLVITLIVQAFHCVWFIIVSLLFYLKFSNFPFIVDKFFRFIPESITISILAPIFFYLFDRIWCIGQEDIIGDNR